MQRVLDVCAFADADGFGVAANDGVEPDARVFGDRDVAQNVDAWGDEDRPRGRVTGRKARIRLTVWVSKGASAVRLGRSVWKIAGCASAAPIAPCSVDSFVIIHQ